MAHTRYFPAEEYQQRLTRVRSEMVKDGLDTCLIASPENVCYLTGLDHQGYFAYQLLVVPAEGQPILITRAMERATIRDQVPDVRHVGYSDGADPLPPAEHEEQDLAMSVPTERGGVGGLQPWSASLGVTVRSGEGPPSDVSNPIRATCELLNEVKLNKGRIGIEKDSSFLPFRIAHGIVSGLPHVEWQDASSLVDNCRIIKSPRELECIRKAAALSDSMMLTGIAAAGVGVEQREVVAAIYQAMFRRGGTYPAFIPLIRSTHTLEHEHGTWDDRRLRQKDILFIEMSGCVQRYHAPIGRLVHIGKAPARSSKIQGVCREALESVVETIAPGVTAGEVYSSWQRPVDRAGLEHYRRHHCGYSVGLGFPPSWSGGGVPVGLRAGSDLELKPGMVFHVLSWLLRTGRGDSFLSDTVIVTDRGSEMLTTASRDLIIR